MQIIKMPNQVINGSLRNLNFGKVDAIALHHMAHPTWGIKDIERAHLDKGWSTIGYNFWIAFDGTVYEGRGFNMGAGVLNQNDHIISIGFQGDYHNINKEMPDVQFNAGIDTINYIQSIIKNVKLIGGHRDFMSTACPGKYFPLDEMKTLNKRGGTNMFQDVGKDDWAYNHIKKIKDAGIVNGDENGNYNPDKPVTRREVAVMIANALSYLGK